MVHTLLLIYSNSIISYQNIYKLTCCETLNGYIPIFLNACNGLYHYKSFSVVICEYVHAYKIARTQKLVRKEKM